MGGMLNFDNMQNVRATRLISGEVAAQETLHLTSFVDKLGAYAHGMHVMAYAETFPESVRVAMTAKLRDFLDRNLEDA